MLRIAPQDEAFPFVAFRASRRPKTAKTKRIFRETKRTVSRRGSKVIEIIGVRNRAVSRDCLFSIT
jgi:hypothetical protein